jgi:hypothetical protein
MSASNIFGSVVWRQDDARRKILGDTVAGKHVDDPYSLTKVHISQTKGVYMFYSLIQDDSISFQFMI